jgi:threonine dehydratase
MPLDAPAMKIENTRALGAEVILYDRDTEDRDEIGAALSSTRGLTLIKPFDEPLVIAGQGSIGLELLEQMPDTTADILVCCGGGGLSSGIALATEGSGLRARPVEPENFDDVTRSLRDGEIRRNVATSGSLCDAIITPQPGDITFPIMHRLCGAGIVVPEDDCLKAMAIAFSRLKIVLEPGGAIALAAALFHGDQIDGDDVVTIASGGNVDPEVFAMALSKHGDLA